MSNVNEQFKDFTTIFSADGYQFVNMRSFLESIEANPVKTEHELKILEAFTLVSKLCKYFLDQNPKV